jgi:hypothetical protein
MSVSESRAISALLLTGALAVLAALLRTKVTGDLLSRQ